MAAVASPLLHAASAAACALWAVLALRNGRRGAMTVLLAACAAGTAFWATAVALHPEAPLSGLAGLMELGRTVLWLVLLLHLHGRDQATATSAPRLLAWVAPIAVFLLLALLPGNALATPSLGSPVLLGRLGLAILVVLLAENVYRNAGEAARWHVNLPCIAIGGLAAFDLVLFADAVLSRVFSPALIDARAVLAALATALLAVAAQRDRRWRRQPPVSRQVVFHAATLMVSGAFLVGVGVAGEALRQIGTSWAQAAQVSLLAGAVMALAVALSSHSARSRIRRLLVDPFFQARYDYRHEWMRCIAVLSGPDGNEPGVEVPPPVRAIRAVADAVDSPAGVLL
ncbi:MAG TPA: PEP-CTERM system histidine kinase PrsK, partial [Roseomonas sp.]